MGGGSGDGASGSDGVGSTGMMVVVDPLVW